MEVKTRRAWILERWGQGWTLAEIGTELGVSKQRIHQITGRLPLRDVNARPIAPLSLAAVEVGMRPETLRRWVNRGWVTLDPTGRVDIEHVRSIERDVRARQCDACGREFHALLTIERFCKKCRKFGGKVYRDIGGMRFKYLSTETKAAHRALTYAWRNRHPEQWTVINKRATMVYRLVRQGMDRREARNRALRRYPIDTVPLHL